MSHTPKPWTTSINDVRHAGRTQLIYGPDQTPINQNGFICEVQAPIVGSEFDSKTRLDNARLIAAAPELLEALEALHECSPCQNGCAPDDMTCASNMARAAIAQVTKEE